MIITNPKCIYCLSEEGPFGSQEHVLPESLGNTEMLLAPGIVCDPCNHGTLSQLDQILIQFPPLALLRVQMLDYTKQGKRPRADFQNMTIEKIDNQTIRIFGKDKTADFKKREKLPDNRVLWRHEAQTRKILRIPLARSLYKVGLGFVAFKLGHDAALEERYDRARRFITNGGAFPNSLLLTRESITRFNTHIRCTFQFGGTLICVSIWGVGFALNLEQSPRVRNFPEFEEDGIIEFELDEVE
jgi:hypothetical protein